MGLNISYIGVSFNTIGKNVDPTEITKLTNIVADDYHIKGDMDPLKRRVGGSFDPNLGYWCVGTLWSTDTYNKVDSSDFNQHLNYLLSILLPHKDLLLTFSTDGNTSFDVFIIYSGNLVSNGSGFITHIDPKNLFGIVQLNASLEFRYFTEYDNLSANVSPGLSK